MAKGVTGEALGLVDEEVGEGIWAREMERVSPACLR